ncbi:Arylsulfatase [Sedimentisphaera cyanobacteriorum]|uniref:Arylsulfatase n=1 Tax=Sedimentisphaera cyanobacteriorum TaxID=1940790 RepID=A0A1Q2HP59_9BACT|nr:arylsulfatase [Sedimentisphaera cyanobacteriorum]AQQ09111.1 Arylsulfatase [Sedimentisphaera cyanobacteriorum]
MNRRNFIKKAAIGIGISNIGFCLNGCKSLENKTVFSQSMQKPDVVLIMADDLGYSDLGCYGGEIHTPNIDKLAENGLRFSQFYNSARCCPTRASLLTGLYPHQAGIGLMVEDQGYEGYRGTLSKNSVTLAEMLKIGGYQTAMVGKWHVARDALTKKNIDNWPLQRGFDKFFGTIPAYGSLWDPAGLVEGNDFIEPWDDFFYTDAIADKAVDYIKTADKSSPMFLYLASPAPHYPLHARKETIDKYKGVYDKGWYETRKQRIKNVKEIGLVSEDIDVKIQDEASKSWVMEQNKDWQAQRMQTYAAMVEELDRSVGKVLQAIKNNRKINNTLILFLSDNGGSAEGHLNDTIERLNSPWNSSFAPEKTPNGEPVVKGDIPGRPLGGPDTFGSYGLNWASVSNTPFRRHKIWVHEGGISTPFIAHWPNYINDAGSICNQVGHITDIMPTLCEVSGTKYPSIFKGKTIKPYEGESLFKVFEGEKRQRKPLFWEHEGNRAVRINKWKLVSEYPGEWQCFYPGQDGKWELYDISEDRGELNDLSKKYPEKVKQMAKKYKEWANKVGVVDWEIISKG